MHAYVYGTLVQPNPLLGVWRGVRYNPYFNEHWETAEGLHVRETAHCYMHVTEDGKPVVNYDHFNFKAD